MFLARPAFDYSSQYVEPVDHGLGPSTVEIMGSGFDAMNAADNTLSRAWNYYDALDRHATRVKELTGEDLIAPGTTADLELNRNLVTTARMDRRRAYVADGGTLDMNAWKRIDQMKQITSRLHELAAKYPDRAAEIMGKPIEAEGFEIGQRRERRALETWEASDQGILAWSANLAGGLAAGFTDPVNLATLPLGPSGLVGTGIKGLIVGALQSGSVNAAVELALQPTIQSYRRDAGMDYGLEQAATNIAMAFGLGAAFDTGVRAPQRAWAALRGLEPRLNDKGQIVGWARPGSPELRVRQETIESAEAGDENAIREVAEATGMDQQPDIRQALDEMEANRPIAEPPAPERARTHDADMIQTMRHVTDADNEPPPVVRDGIGEPLPDIDLALDMARHVRETRARKAPQNLIEFLRREGGIIDDGGDVAQMLGGRNKRPGLINKNGIDLDTAARKAWDEGFISGEGRPSINDLLEALGEDISGNRVVRLSDAEYAEDVRIADEMETDLREAGIETLNERDIRKLYAEREGTRARGAEEVARASGKTPTERTALASLSEDAAGLIQSGDVPAGLGALVGRYVADARQHRAVLSDLAKGSYANEAEAKAALAEMLRSPEYRTEAPGPDVRSPRSRKQLDDPYGAEAQAQIRELEESLLPEQAAIRADEPDTVVVDIPFAVSTNSINGLIGLVRQRLKQGMPVRFSEKSIDEIRGRLTRELDWLPRSAHAAAVSKATPDGKGGVQIEMVDLRTNESFSLGSAIPIDTFLQLRAFHAPAGIVSSKRSATVFSPLASTGVGDRTLAGQAYHEAVHLGKSLKIIPDDVWVRLVGHARDLRVMDMQLGTTLRVVEDPTWKNAGSETLGEEYSRLYVGRQDFDQRLDEESVAHFVELAHHGHWLPMEIEPVKDILDDFFSGRMFGEARVGADADVMASVRSLAERNNAIAVDDIEADVQAPHPDRLVLAFHGTDQAFSRFDLDRSRDVGHHFGTAAQAGDRALLAGEGRPTRVLPVVLDLRNPITLPDLGTWDPRQIYKALIRQGVQFTDAEARLFDGVIEEPDAIDEVLRMAMDRAGYDGIRYLNRTEGVDTGNAVMRDKNGDLTSGWSYITWKPDTVRSATDPDHMMYSIRAEQGKRAVDELGFYSGLLEAAKGLKQAKGTPEQMLAQIKKAPGVRTSEIEATGLEETLAAITDKTVTRDQIVEYLELSRVKVMEGVHWGGKTNQGNLGLAEFENMTTDELLEFLNAPATTAPTTGPNGPAKWASYSLDPSNPTYRETVMHLPTALETRRVQDLAKQEEEIYRRLSDARGQGRDVDTLQDEYNQVVRDLNKISLEDFRSGHFDEPNAISHLRTSIQPDADGRQNFVINELQSDWGQKIRDSGGGRDEAKIADLKRQASEVAAKEKEIVEAGRNEHNRLVREAEWFEVTRERDRINAELQTAENAAPANPLVNTTDQWVNTSLRRALIQAVEADADYIAIASGETVDTFGMGAPLEGLQYAYNQMYPKKLRDIIKRLDKDAATPEQFTGLTAHDGSELRATRRFHDGDGNAPASVTRFPLTDKVKEAVRGDGLPMFAFRAREAAESRVRQQSLQALQIDIADINADIANGRYNDREAIQQRRARLLNGQAEIRVLEDITQWRDARGRADPATAYRMLHEGYEGGKDLKHLSDSIWQDVLRRMAAPMWHWRKGAILGDARRRWNPAVNTNLINTLREMSGQATGDQQAQQFARAIADTNEYLRQRANAAGMDIGRLQGWFAPQYHDPEVWLRAGRREMVDYHMQTGVLDRARMVDANGQPLDDAALRQLLSDVWETVTTEGANRREVGQGFGRGALYRRRAEHRVLHYASADAYIAYNRRYGNGDIYGALMGHMRKLTQDIAAMERFGANPETTRGRLRDILLQDAANQRVTDSLFDDLERQVGELSAVLDQATQATAAGHMGRLRALYNEIDTVRDEPGYRAAIEGLAGRRSDQIRERVDALQDQMDTVHQDLRNTLQAPAATPEQIAMFGRIHETLVDIEQQDLYPVMSRDPVKRAERIIDASDKIWGHFTGSASVPQSAGFAGMMSGSRNIVMASTLIYSPFSAIADQATQMAARKFIGMPATRQLYAFLRGFTNADRELALQLGLGAEFVMPAFAQQARLLGQIDARSVTGFMGDRSHAFSGLSPMTSASKIAWKLDFVAFMARQQAVAYDDLDGPVRRMLDRHQVTEAEWNTIRAVPPEIVTRGGRSLRMLTHRAIAQATGDLDLAERYTTMMLREGAHSTIEGDMRSRAMWVSDQQPGTLLGEALRSVAMIKSFPTRYAMAIVGRHFNEMMAGRLLTTNSAASAAAILFGGTMLGALAIQGRHVAQGRDPENMLTAKFWGHAFMQSGGLGIFGDFIFNSVNRFGGGLSATLAGPLVDRIGNVFNLTLGNAIQFASDEKTNFGRELTKFARMNTPGMFAPWYVRMAYQRMVLDEFQKAADPEYYRSFRQQQQWYRRNNQEFYWPPGSPLPQRPPQMGAAVRTN